MGFAQQLRIMSEFFVRERMEFALVGGFALHAFGYTRATRDVDFITHLEHQPSVVGYLESLGFETLHRSEGFSNHLLALESMRVDLVYVAGETATAIFRDALPRLVLAEVQLPVVSPEHLILMKLFAIRNDPGRKFRELADIREVLARTTVDRELIRRHFADQGLQAYFDDLIANLDP